MNLNKFNFYKNAKYFSVASLIILIAGLVVGFVFSLNFKEALGASIIVYTTLAILITMVFSFVYLHYRYDNSLAFCFTFAIFFNVALMVAICGIIRVPVSNIFVGSIFITIFFTVILNMPIFIKLWQNREEKLERDKLVNNCIKLSLKEILMISGIFLLTIIVCLIILENEVIMLVRPAVIGLILSTFTAIFMLPAIWGYFYADKPIKKRQIDITVYSENDENKQPMETEEKQKVETEN